MIHNLAPPHGGARLLMNYFYFNISKKYEKY